MVSSLLHWRQILYWQPSGEWYCAIYVYHISNYTLNLHNIIFQLCLNLKNHQKNKIKLKISSIFWKNMDINPFCWLVLLCPREGHDILFEIYSPMLKTFILVSRTDFKLSSHHKFVSLERKIQFWSSWYKKAFAGALREILEHFALSSCFVKILSAFIFLRILMMGFWRFYLLKKYYLFIYLAAPGSLLWHEGSSSLIGDWTQAPCIWSAES